MSMYSMEDIARFVEGDLDTVERAKFEEALQIDSELQSAVAMYRDINSSLKMKLVEDDHDRAFGQTLDEAGKLYVKPRAKIVSLRPYLAWTSAVAAVFLVLLIWAPWRNNLYQEYAGTEMIAVAERGNHESNQIDRAVKAFNAKDFSQASIILGQISKTDSSNVMVQYYYGISLIETDETDAARRVLQKIYSGASVYKYDAAFYIALSFLKQKDEDNTRIWLQKIPEDAAKAEKSRELLDKLK